MRLAGDPVADQAVSERKQGRTEKQTHEAEGQDAAEHAKQHHHQRQVAAAADQVGLEHVVHPTDDHQPPEGEKHAHAIVALPEQPGGGRPPDQWRPHGD
ncbi:hypothetical protein D9M71_526840 [compost metagenome]